MAGISAKIDLDLVRLNKKLKAVMEAGAHLQPVMEDIGDYMVRSHSNRIFQQKQSPSGAAWARLAQSTIQSKGSDNILVDSGELGRSFYVEDVSDREVTVTTDKEYASYMQDGFNHRGRRKPNKRQRAAGKTSVPARPFMGFSDANNRRISQMLRKHLADALKEA
jgi:phage virion morphogenesis protein